MSRLRNHAYPVLPNPSPDRTNPFSIVDVPTVQPPRGRGKQTPGVMTSRLYEMVEYTFSPCSHIPDNLVTFV